MKQYSYYKNNEFAPLFTDPDTGFKTREGQRDHQMVTDAEITSTGFAGTENIDWVNINTFVNVAGTGMRFREGVRNGGYVVDVELTVTGFAGIENIDWEVATSWSDYLAAHPPIGLTLTGISGGIQIDWTDNTGGVAQTEIWGQSDGAAYTLLYTIAAGIVTKSETVTPVDLRYYKIRALRNGLYSAFTAPSSIALLSAEIIINGDFTVPTGWTKDAVWTISGGKANYTKTGNGYIYRAGTATIGKKYRIRLDISGALGNISANFIYDGARHFPAPFNAALSISNGSYEYNLVCSSTTAWAPQIQGLTTGSSFSVDNWSIKEILFP